MGTAQRGRDRRCANGIVFTSAATQRKILVSSEVNMAIRWVCVTLLCLATCQLCISSSQFLPNLGRAESQFARHRTFRPSAYHGREKRQLQHTRRENGHVNDLSIIYSLDNDSYILDLRLNRDLVPDGYFEKYHQDGEQITERSNGTAKQAQLCQYQGQIRHVPKSWAALSTCAGLRGVIFDGQELHYVEPQSGSSLDDEHLLMKHSDLTANFSCGTHSALPHSSHSHPRVRRQTDLPSGTPAASGPFKANSRSRYVELVLVVDNKSYESQDKDLNRVFRRCKDIANIVNALYAPLNIFVALVGIVVWSEKDEIQISVKGDETLTNFLHYRRVRLSKEHPNDNAQLLTGVQFQGGVVGKALKGPMCTYEFSGGVAMDHSPTVGLVATTVAHEMGHNFGMEHDNDSLCHCPDDKCIMAASSSAVSPTHWSSCSLENLALAFEHGMDYCLRNKPVSLFKSPECGNMFVEDGEECDCGLPGRCDNPCCNAHTCKLHVNATCATGDCCDTATCRMKNAGSPCRSSLQECDLPEFCTGKSEYCPVDLHKLDGTSCGQDKAYCYEGSCRSHSDQCRLLWGPSGKGSDAKCYDQNTHGNKTGNCGYLKANDTFAKCLDENTHCGLLHCSHLNERLEFGMESVAVLSHSFFNVEGKIIPCRTANVDLGLQDVDPGLVPNGAKCGHNKMCVDQRCVAVSSIIKAGCPQKCGQNGECNNLGKCHCKVGFDPPYCQHFGAGGSEDGGPASDPNVRNGFVVAMFIIFLGIFPIMALAFCCWYCCRDRQQRTQLWAKIMGGPKLSLPTRGSPDFTQPPSSSNSSTTSSPSRRIQYRGRLFCPVSWWTNKMSSRRLPADEPTTRNNTVKIEISRPMPIRPNKLGIIGNGSTPSVTTASVSRAPPSSIAQNLAGQYPGVTLSPLTENADSSFDSFDSADSADAPSRNPAPVINGGVPKNETNKSVGVVAARASFFSNGPVSSSNATAASSVPVRPAPAAPVASSASPPPKPAVSLPPRNQISTTPTLGHTEIVISKTIVPVSTNDSLVITVGKPELPPKGRPLSIPNACNVKGPNWTEPVPSQSVPTSAAAGSAQPSSSSTLQKVASLFKTNPTQATVNHPESMPDAASVSENEGSTLPRNQSIKATKINRESLRGLEISNPILQSTIEMPSKVVPVRPAPAPPPSSTPSPPPPAAVPVVSSPTTPTSKLGISSTLPRLPKPNKVHFADDNEKSDKTSNVKLAPVVERSESMRLRGVTNRPNIPQFGSMRAKRPLSMPFTRPTSPPPKPPNAKFATSPIVENDYPYDDCSAVTQAEEDAIYASIEDLPRDGSSADRDEAGSTTTSNSDGLLSEIVCELKKKNLDDVYSVTKKNKASVASTIPECSQPVATTAAKTTTAPLQKNALSRFTATNSSSAPPTAKPTTAPVATAPTEGYKPFSSIMGSRGRYLGTTAVTSTATSVVDAAASRSVSSAPSPVTTVSATKTTASVQPVTAVVNSANLQKTTPSASKPMVPVTTSAESTTRNSHVPLPQQPPVGKLPLSSKIASSVTEQSTRGSGKTVLEKPTPVTNGTVASKRPMSPDRETNVVKPGVHQLGNATAKSKFPNSKLSAASKQSGAPVKSGAGSSVPKLTKPSVTGSAFRSTANNNSTTSVSSSKATTSTSPSVSTSSPVGANIASSGKHNSSASHVQTMQQKFDTSNSINGPVVSASSNKATSALPAKSKSNPKR
ncbi:mucin-5AC [Daphnia magna]|uniref:mucin-5AC n=1 Tax=Daphnia magna TaxID=35525 RepID=UPI001E1BC13C|nr:mucin-5AC [Daphnia magna]